MKIAIIGGLDRNEAALTKVAEAAGHELECHTGVPGGRGAAEVRSAVERADFVIILTDVNSHGGVLVAKKAARQAGRGTFVTRRCGLSRFQQLLDALTAKHDRERCATLRAAS